MHRESSTSGSALSPRAPTRWPGWPWLLATLLAANFAVGILPFSPAEGDEQGVINGLHEMLRGTNANLSLRYDYEFQSGSYQLVLLLHRLFGGEVSQLFFALSTLCAVGMLGLSAQFVATWARISLGWSLCLILLCQELTTAAFYANTSTIGAFWAFAGLLLLLRHTSGRAVVVAGVLFGLAGWCRLDALMLAPATLPMLRTRHTAGRSIALTALAAATTLLTLTLLFASVGLGWSGIFAHFRAIEGGLPFLGASQMLTTLYLETSLLLTGCAAAGLALALRAREWRLPTLFASVAIPGLLIHGTYLASPKYLYYLAPLIALAAVTALQALLPAAFEPGSGAARLKRLAAALLLAGLVAEFATSLRTSSADFRRLTPTPTCATFASLPFNGKIAAWVVGPGELIGCSDAFRLRTGYGFAPWVWHREKQSALAELARMKPVFGTSPEVAVLTSTYLANRCAVGELRRQGFTLEETVGLASGPLHRIERWQRGTTICWLALINNSPGKAEAFAACATRFARVPTYFFNDLGAIAAREFLEPNPAWLLLSPREDGLLSCYVRTTPAG